MTDISEDDIRTRAYALWEAAGCPDGSHDEHWLEALRQLTDGSRWSRHSDEDFQDFETFGRQERPGDRARPQETVQNGLACPAECRWPGLRKRMTMLIDASGCETPGSSLLSISRAGSAGQIFLTSDALFCGHRLRFATSWDLKERSTRTARAVTVGTRIVTCVKILSVTSEIFPLIKTGGLADVTGSLPKALTGYELLHAHTRPGLSQAVCQAHRRPAGSFLP